MMTDQKQSKSTLTTFVHSLKHQVTDQLGYKPTNNQAPYHTRVNSRTLEQQH